MNDKEENKPVISEGEIEKLFKKWASHKTTCEVNYEANGDCDCGWYEVVKKIRLSSPSPNTVEVSDDLIYEILLIGGDLDIGLSRNEAIKQVRSLLSNQTTGKNK